VLTEHLSEVIERGLSRLAGDDIECQLGIANKIVSFDSLSVDERVQQLFAVVNMGISVMIFVCEYKSNKLGAAPYTFLGLVDCVKSEGLKPINVAWKLRKPIPAKYTSKTNQLTVRW
jgi:hypothetical protein